MAKVSFNELFLTLESILLKNGFEADNAELCAKVFSENTLVGVSSHGSNRFYSFINFVKSGHINPTALPTKENSFNAFEQWNGNLGAGPSNAHTISIRAQELAKEFGIGCVALKNTNHWMRPGYYAWEAAENGFVFLCWTNTIPLMPPWGAKDARLGNNPIVFGVPRKDGHIVLDMALSQYSFGKMSNYIREGKELPYTGGYDQNGNLTKNAKDIYEAQRPLPIGLWKGSGLSLLLDLISTILSGGKSTFELSKDNVDSGMSQIFIAINPTKFQSADLIEKSINEILEFYFSADKSGNEEILYPGERILKIKKENLKNGITIDEKIWEKILELKNE